MVCLLIVGALLRVPLAGLERLEPLQGCYFGVNLGQGDTVDWLRTRLGLTPAVYVQFFHFPFTDQLRADLNGFFDQVRPIRGIALITLEPFQGLDAVTEADCLELAGLCRTNEALGLGGIMIRFAHEMNGNWYPWCQQPVRYRNQFRLLADIIHTNTARTAMLWAPHNGIGYPFATNLYQATPGSPDFAELDTNGDGRLTPHDDMYQPYYPGDDAVDWVGMTIYHWGVEYPWRENEMPPANIFASTLTGAGHQPPIPDFYARYCADGVHNKPLAIPETAAFYNPHQPAGPGEFLIKQAWWRQVFNVSHDFTEAANLVTDLPKLKCINWFDHYKPEAEAQYDWIDWRITARPELREAFVEHLRAPREGRPYFLTAPEFDCVQREKDHCILDAELPRILPVVGSFRVSLTTQAPTNCDLVVDLLDQEFNWCAGARAAVEAGVQSATLYLTVDSAHSLANGHPYRWSIFLTPTGGDYLQALAWYDSPGPVARVIEPSISIVGYSPLITVNSNFMVKVHYTSARDDAVAQVNILDHDYHWHGGRSVVVARGEGLLDLTVSPQATLTNGAYLLESFLSDSSTNWQNVMARSDHHPVQVNNGILEDVIETRPQPAVIAAGDVFRFLVSYAALAERDLHVDLLDARTNFIAGAVQRVGASSGIQELTIGHPEAGPGIYFVNSFLTEPGQTWTQALAWSASRTIDVLPPNYMAWVGWRWGAVVGSDSFLPGDDADGDGMNNDSERIAHTAPLDSQDNFRLRISRDGQQPFLRWQSALFRTYQLYASPRPAGGVWVPWGDGIDGTGQTMEVPLSPSASGLRAYYRLTVTEQ